MRLTTEEGQKQFSAVRDWEYSEKTPQGESPKGTVINSYLPTLIHSGGFEPALQRYVASQTSTLANFMAHIWSIISPCSIYPGPATRGTFVCVRVCVCGGYYP